MSALTIGPLCLILGLLIGYRFRLIVESIKAEDRTALSMLEKDLK